MQKIKPMKKRRQNFLRKIWHFLWESESIASWLACLLICFLVVMFVFFPLAGFVLSTPLPFVVVKSESMEHNGDFDNWWLRFGEWYEKHNIPKDDAIEWAFSNGISKGDIIIVKGKDKYVRGDVIIFKVNEKTPIIHRVVQINSVKEVVSTKGDNNPSQMPKEQDIAKAQIIGKAAVRIPKLGWIKLFPCTLCPGCCSFIDEIRNT